MSSVTRTAVSPLQGGVGYELTTHEQWTPDAVAAEWDGSGAAGDFVVAVSYYNNGGALIDRAFPEGVTNAPGDTGRTFFRPFKRGSGGGGGGITSTLGVYEDTPRAAPPGSDTPFQFQFVGGAQLLDLSFATAPQLIAAGLYIVTAWVFSVALPNDAGKTGTAKMFQTATGAAGPFNAAWQSFSLDPSLDAASAAITLPWVAFGGDFFEVTVDQNTAGSRDFGCALNVVHVS